MSQGRFEIVHQIADRTRIRLKSPVNIASGELEKFADSLRGVDGIDDVIPRQHTKCLVVYHRDVDEPGFLQLVGQAGLMPTKDSSSSVKLERNQDSTGSESSASGFGDVQLNSGNARLVLALFFLILAVGQALRGQIMVPAFTLLWYAFESIWHRK